MPLRVGMRVVGGLGVAGSHLSRQTLEAIGSLVAIAIERAASFEKLSRAEASRESEQLRSVLLDSVTHEFRSPLTAIKASATSLLGSGTHSPEEHHELLTIINEESDRLNRLIGEAAEMAQLDANKVEFRFEPTPVQVPVDAALDELKQLLTLHPVDVRIPADLPPARMDSSHIREVMVHLLENAAKYSPPNSPIRITAEAKETTKDRMLTVSIADRGPGIDDFEQSLVFEKFYRGRNQRVSVHGTGMGLAICKAIVEAHGGLSVSPAS